MTFEKKYLKYKKKYLDLCKTAQKLSIGGGVNNNDDCPVCVEPMNAKVGDINFRELDCGHVIHYQCLFDLIDRSSCGHKTLNECPVCREPPRYIYSVSQDMSSLPDERRRRILAQIHSRDATRIDVNELDAYYLLDEYRRLRQPYLDGLSPQERRVNAKSYWERCVFINELGFIPDLESLSDIYNDFNNSMRLRVLALYRLEDYSRMDLSNNPDYSRDEFEERLEALKDLLFDNDTAVEERHSGPDPRIITPAQYQQLFNEQRARLVDFGIQLVHHFQPQVVYPDSDEDEDDPFRLLPDLVDRDDEWAQAILQREESDNPDELVPAIPQRQDSQPAIPQRQDSVNLDELEQAIQQSLIQRQESVNPDEWEQAMQQSLMHRQNSVDDDELERVMQLSLIDQQKYLFNKKK